MLRSAVMVPRSGRRGRHRIRRTPVNTCLAEAMHPPGDHSAVKSPDCGADGQILLSAGTGVSALVLAPPESARRSSIDKGHNDPMPRPQFCPTPRELDDLELLTHGVLGTPGRFDSEG